MRCSANKTLFISMRCLSRMLVSKVPKSIIVMNSIDTRFSRNVFEAVQKTRSTCFFGSKTTRLRLVVLNPIKHSCSFFKHYLRLVSAYDRRLQIAIRSAIVCDHMETTSAIVCAIRIADRSSFHMIADDRRPYCDWRSAIRDHMETSL